jgi:hypothetical protein
LEQVAERKQGKFQGKTKPRPPKEVIWSNITLELTLVKLPNGLLVVRASRLGRHVACYFTSKIFFHSLDGISIQ